jgi:hypothetical protein
MTTMAEWYAVSTASDCSYTRRSVSGTIIIHLFLSKSVASTYNADSTDESIKRHVQIIDAYDIHDDHLYSFVRPTMDPDHC